MKDEREITKRLEHACCFKEEDPSQYYKIVGKDSDDGLGDTVYCCRRKIDGKKFTLKSVNPQNQNARQNQNIREMAEQEIGVMRIIESDHIVKCIEAFDYKDRMMAVFERMEGGQLTPMLETEQGGNYSEEFCKYSLYKTLQAMLVLHR